MSTPVKIARQPRRWPKFLQVDKKQAHDLPTTAGGVLWTLAKENRVPLILGSIANSVNYISMALVPMGLGKLLDSGLEKGFGVHMLPWTFGLIGIVMMTGVGSAITQLTDIAGWMSGPVLGGKSVAARTSKRGRSITQKIAPGDIVTTITSDTDYVGALFAFIPAIVAALTSTAVVAYLMLKTSVVLGLVVLIGLPLVIIGLACVVPVLQRRQMWQREARGVLTNLGADSVAGLRILRGIGGEDEFHSRYTKQSRVVRDRGITVAAFQAILDTSRAAAPSAFTIIVVAIAAMMVYDGELSAGHLVAFYGYTTFLSSPLNAATNTIQVGTRAWVGAKKIAHLHQIESRINSRGDKRVDWPAADLVDEATGTRVEPGKITALVAVDPDDSARVATRLTRVDDQDRVWYAGVDAREIPVSNIRENLVLSGAKAQLFVGTLRDAILGPRAQQAPARPLWRIITDYVKSEGKEPQAHYSRQAVDDAVMHALWVADGEDIAGSLAGGLDGHLTEKGRSLSGGQRQRVALARAIYTDATALVLIEPTSAVDSHTEARIASRIAKERAGRTTLIVSESPLVLEQCDEVIVLDETGRRELGRGTHNELSTREDAAGRTYRRIAQRATGVEQ
ncbi:ABC transporter ATP-binding protein [Gleimia hominis]|uniref:ABC transporter ATP-binding protein n=1 Tax=Gleimia hominis TaxID=595468 RepID=A0ABU3IA35_9ACTO|nr:ABC transporter ATP-binding protein [Gleimia hominis]MDT3767235.1 ABC transporter ATP-binding protein [Gleimia hominis]